MCIQMVIDVAHVAIYFSPFEDFLAARNGISYRLKAKIGYTFRL